MQLDSKQAAMLARAAALLPPAQQDGFRSSVHGVLSTLLHYPPTDAELRDTCRFILAGRGVAVGVAVLLPPPSERRYVHDRSSNNWQSWRKRTPASAT